jgi:hypothetical protein
LSAREFLETRDGACRIAPRFAAQLTDTCAVWRSHIAPVVEESAHTLATQSLTKQPMLTPLTHRNRKRALDPDRRQRRSPSEFAVLPNTCRDCGAPLPDRRRHYCDEHRAERLVQQGPAARERAALVLAQLRAEQRDPAHGGRAGEIRGRKNAAHQAAVRTWECALPDPEVFRSEILPALRRARIADVVTATGLSEHYCSLIRLGKKIPHPRHWDALRAVTG